MWGLSSPSQSSPSSTDIFSPAIRITSLALNPTPKFLSLTLSLHVLRHLTQVLVPADPTHQLFPRLPAAEKRTTSHSRDDSGASVSSSVK